MNHYTIILDIDDDGVVRLSSNTLGGARVAIIRSGSPERVIQVRYVCEADIEQYVRNFRAADLSGAWHGLDDARDVVCEAARHVVDVASELIERLHVPIASRLDRRDAAALLADTLDANAEIDAAERDAERLLAAIRHQRAVVAQAADTIANDDTRAAHAENQQQPHITIEGRRTNI